MRHPSMGQPLSHPSRGQPLSGKRHDLGQPLQIRRQATGRGQPLQAGATGIGHGTLTSAHLGAQRTDGSGTLTFNVQPRREGTATSREARRDSHLITKGQPPHHKVLMERKFFALAGKTEMPCCSVAGDSHLDPVTWTPVTWTPGPSLLRRAPSWGSSLGWGSHPTLRMGQPPDPRLSSHPPLRRDSHPLPARYATPGCSDSGPSLIPINNA